MKMMWIFLQNTSIIEKILLSGCKDYGKALLQSKWNGQGI